jgi:hypothetical protein
MLFMLLMSIASESDRIDLPDFVKRISGLFVAYIGPGRRIENLEQLLLCCSGPAALLSLDSTNAEILDG